MYVCLLHYYILIGWYKLGIWISTDIINCSVATPYIFMDVCLPALSVFSLVCLILYVRFYWQLGSPVGLGHRWHRPPQGYGPYFNFFNYSKKREGFIFAQQVLWVEAPLTISIKTNISAIKIERYFYLKLLPINSVLWLPDLIWIAIFFVWCISGLKG